MKENTPKKNFTVPLLELGLTREKTPSKSAKNDAKIHYNSAKFGAGYKPRCSDLERWQIYRTNESQFVQSGLPNFSCIFNFLDNDVNNTEENENKDKELQINKNLDNKANQTECTILDSNIDHEELTSKKVIINEEMNKTILITKNSNTPNLDRMDDKLLIINNKIHYKNLEEFNIKKFNQAHFVEWEQEMRVNIGKFCKAKEPEKNPPRSPNSHDTLKSPRTKKNRQPKVIHSANLSAVTLEQFTATYDLERQYDNLRITINPLLLLKEKEQKKLEEIKKKQRESKLRKLDIINNTTDNNHINIIDNIENDHIQNNHNNNHNNSSNGNNHNIDIYNSKFLRSSANNSRRTSSDDEDSKRKAMVSPRKQKREKKEEREREKNHEKNHKEENDLSLDLNGPLSPKKKLTKEEGAGSSSPMKKRLMHLKSAITPRKRGKDSSDEKNPGSNLSSPREISEEFISPRENGRNIGSDEELIPIPEGFLEGSSEQMKKKIRKQYLKMDQMDKNPYRTL